MMKPVLMLTLLATVSCNPRLRLNDKAGSLLGVSQDEEVRVDYGNLGSEVSGLTIDNSISSVCSENFYFVDYEREKKTTIYKGKINNRLNVELLQKYELPFLSGHIALSPISEKIVMVEGGSKLMTFSPENRELKEIGTITNESGKVIKNIHQVGISPSNDLYVASSTTDMLYIVNQTTAKAKTIGLLYDRYGKTVNISGGDLAFDSSGDLYLAGKLDNKKSIYRVDLNERTVSFIAGNVGNITGIAFLGEGREDLIISSRGNKMYQVDKITGSVTSYETYQGDSSYNIAGSDLTSFCSNNVESRYSHSDESLTNITDMKKKVIGLLGLLNDLNANQSRQTTSRDIANGQRSIRETNNRIVRLRNRICTTEPYNQSCQVVQ